MIRSVGSGLRSTVSGGRPAKGGGVVLCCSTTALSLGRLLAACWALQLQLGAHLSNVAANVPNVQAAAARGAHNGHAHTHTRTQCEPAHSDADDGGGGKKGSPPPAYTHTRTHSIRIYGRPHMHNSQCRGGAVGRSGRPFVRPGSAARRGGTTADLINQNVSHRYSFGH